MTTCHALRTPPPRRHTVEDDLLRQFVLDELTYDPRLGAARVAVRVDEGIATLAGAVPNNQAKQAAARLAAGVAGIRAVANGLRVASTLHDVRHDTLLAAEVANVLSWNSVLGAQQVSARVEHGWVILEGTASSSRQRFEAGCAVQALPGVRGLTNLIRVCSMPGAERLSTRVREALLRSGLDHVEVLVSPQGLVLSGMVDDQHASLRAEALARWCGAHVADNQIRVQTCAQAHQA